MSCQIVAELLAECDRLRAELAASQACVAQMRDALRHAAACLDTDGHDPIIDKTLTLPVDNTALKTCLKKERERCARRCEDFAEGDGRWCAAVIRNLGDE